MMDKIKFFGKPDELEPTSSLIRKIEYLPGNIMEIEFQTGGTYHYLDVPKETFQQALDAHSIGKFFYSSIRGHFATVRQ